MGSTPGMLPPGMNPFFPHGGMMLPGGIPNPFHRFQTDTTRMQQMFEQQITKNAFPRPPWQQKRANTLGKLSN